MVPNIVFAPNIRITQNTDTGHKTQTQLITGLQEAKFPKNCMKTRMHSSRMHIARFSCSLGERGVCLGGCLPGGCLPRDGYLPRGVYTLPVNRMTDKQV